MSNPFDTTDDNSDPGPALDALPTNEKDYIIPAQDAKGHSYRLYCRAMPAVSRLVADVVQSRKYPFRTQGDLIRYAIVHTVRRLAAGAGVNSVIAQADAMISVLQDEEFQLQFMDFFAHLRRVTDHYMASGSPGEARRVVAKMQASIANMEPGYWRERYELELINGWGTILDAQGTARGSFDIDAHATDAIGVER